MTYPIILFSTLALLWGIRFGKSYFHHTLAVGAWLLVVWLSI